MSWRDPYLRGAIGSACHAGLFSLIIGLDFSSLATALIALTSLHVGLEAAWSNDDTTDRAGFEIATGVLLFALSTIALRDAVSRGSMTGGGWGLVAVAVGSGLRLAAIRRLQERFVTCTAERRGPLERGGVYALVRHPSELGLGVYAAGLATVSGSGLGWLILAVGVGLGWRRVRREECALIGLHGPRYREYAGRTPAVIPDVTPWLSRASRGRGLDPG
ncbi:MAG: isoprenylcysteine carboxylmethyltransferase family protein [Myxococcota bacterium]